jgi:hypothetical protein
VFGQFPNLPLWIFIGAVVVRLVIRPEGNWGTGLDIVADIALLWWASLEVFAGVNRWRRILGSVVAILVVFGLVFTFL